MGGRISAASASVSVLFLLTAEAAPRPDASATGALSGSAGAAAAGREASATTAGGRLVSVAPVPPACNVSGAWCWQHSVPPMAFDEAPAAAAGGGANFTISNPTGRAWTLAHGAQVGLYPTVTLEKQLLLNMIGKPV
jgi:hypothetical protein